MAAAPPRRRGSQLLVEAHPGQVAVAGARPRALLSHVVVVVRAVMLLRLRGKQRRRQHGRKHASCRMLGAYVSLLPGGLRRRVPGGLLRGGVDVVLVAAGRVEANHVAGRSAARLAGHHVPVIRCTQAREAYRRQYSARKRRPASTHCCCRSGATIPARRVAPRWPPWCASSQSTTARRAPRPATTPRATHTPPAASSWACRPQSSRRDRRRAA